MLKNQGDCRSARRHPDNLSHPFVNSSFEKIQLTSRTKVWEGLGTPRSDQAKILQTFGQTPAIYESPLKKIKRYFPSEKKKRNQSIELTSRNLHSSAANILLGRKGVKNGKRSLSSKSLNQSEDLKPRFEMLYELGKEKQMERSTPHKQVNNRIFQREGSSDCNLGESGDQDPERQYYKYISDFEKCSFKPNINQHSRELAREDNKASPFTQLYSDALKRKERDEEIQQFEQDKLKQEQNKLKASRKTVLLASNKLYKDIRAALSMVEEEGEEDFITMDKLIALLRLLCVVKYYKSKNYYEGTLVQKTSHNYKERAKETVRMRIQRQHQFINGLWSMLSFKQHQKFIRRDLLLSLLFVLYASRLTVQERVDHIYDTIQEKLLETQEELEKFQSYFSKEKQKSATVGAITEVVRVFKQLNADSFAIQREYIAAKKVIGPEYTFKPKITDRSVRLDQRKGLRLVKEEVKRQNISSPISAMDNSALSQHTIMSNFPMQIGGEALYVQDQQRMPLQPREQFEQKIMNSSRFDQLYKKGREKQQILSMKQREKAKEEDKECTFKPRLMRKRTDSKFSESDEATQNVYQRLFSMAEKRKEEKEKSEPSWKAKEQKQLEECTFRPQLKTSESRVNASFDTAMHKGIDVHVSRMRDEYKRRVDRQLAYEQQEREMTLSLGRTHYPSEGRSTQPKPFELRTDKRGGEKPVPKAAILTFEVLISKGRQDEKKEQNGETDDLLSRGG